MFIVFEFNLKEMQKNNHFDFESLDIYNKAFDLQNLIILSMFAKQM